MAFFRVPVLWKDLGHLIPRDIGKVMGHDSRGSVAQGSQKFQTLFWRGQRLHHCHHHCHLSGHLLSTSCAYHCDEHTTGLFNVMKKIDYALSINLIVVLL